MVANGKLSRSMSGTEGADGHPATSFRPVPWLVADEHLDRVASAAGRVVFVVALPRGSRLPRRAPPG